MPDPTRSIPTLLLATLAALAPAARAQQADSAIDPGARDAWAFLAAKYDGDHDGRITAAEYTRGADAFARLDLDGDGAITAGDWAEPPPSAEALATAQAVGAQMVALLYLSPAGDHRTLERAALPAAVAALDTDHDGRVQRSEFEARSHGPEAPFMPPMVATLVNGADPWVLLTQAADADGDGALNADELAAWFDARDAAHSGRWTADDLRRPCMMAIMGTIARPRTAPGATAAPAPASPPSAPATHDAGHHAEPPAVREVATVGQRAPDFTLGTKDGSRRVTLASFAGEQPVALIFGSYSCPPFRNSAAHLRQIFNRYRDRVQFLLVYIREAHALDGDWPITEQGMPLIEDPGTLDERRSVAQQCTVALELGELTALVDDLDDSVGAAWDAAPDRLYVVGRDGRVVFQGGPGPSGFDADAWEAAIQAELLGGSGAGTPPPR